MEEEKKIKWEDVEKGLNESEEVKTYEKVTEIEKVTGRSSQGNLDLSPEDIKEMHKMLDQVIQEGGFISLAILDESQGGIASKIYLNRKTEKQKEQMDRLFIMKNALRSVCRDNEGEGLHPLVQYSMQLKDFIGLSKAFAEHEMQITAKLMSRVYQNGDDEERALLESSMDTVIKELKEENGKVEEKDEEDDN